MKIRLRIALWIAAAGLLSSLLFSLVVFYEMAEQPLQLLDNELKMAGTSLIKRLAENPLPGKSTREMETSEFMDGYWIRVYGKNQRLLYQSKLAEQIDLPVKGRKHRFTVQVKVPQKNLRLHQDKWDNVAFRVRILKRTVNNLPFLVQIARPMEKFDEEIVDLIIFLVLGLAASTLLLLLLSYFAAGQVLKPINAINLLAREINEKTLGKRIPLGKSRDELYQLSNSLNQMFDRLQYSFRQQKQFLASASHELKTPITMLRLFMDDAVHRQDLDNTFKQQLNRQRDNLFRMDRLVKNLLDLSALELRDTVEKQDFNLTILIEKLLEEFSPAITTADISLKTRLEENLQMQGDQEKIRRLLINIIDNAIKYNHEKGVMELETRQEAGNIVISLYNSGPGIPTADLNKVFEQFYRVEKSRSQQYGGAGLGLAIARQIVKLHHGRATMESDAESWTRITVTLPQNSS
jgi:signal transduction histidine kinase